MFSYLIRGQQWFFYYLLFVAAQLAVRNDFWLWLVKLFLNRKSLLGLNHVLDLQSSAGLSFDLMNMIENKKYNLQACDAESLFFLFVCPVRGSGPLCFSSPSSSWVLMWHILQQAMGRNHPLRQWWAAWTATPADTARQCESRHHGKTCPRWSFGFPQRWNKIIYILKNENWIRFNCQMTVI